MSGGDKVLLIELKERTSAAGNRYLSGWLGKASVVAFLDRDAAEPTWQVFVASPQTRSGGANVPSASRSPLTPQPRRKRTGPAKLGPGELDDRVDDI